jgi:signal transduction histidine kinase
MVNTNADYGLSTCLYTCRRRYEKGSGPGLFLVKELLQKLNAALLIESEKGMGSSFVIKLEQR